MLLPLPLRLAALVALVAALFAFEIAGAADAELGEAGAGRPAALGGRDGTGPKRAGSSSAIQALVEALGRSPALRRPPPGSVAQRPPLLLARVRSGHSVVLHRRPGSRGGTRLGARTEFGSPRVLAVTAVRGRWLGVASVARPDGRLSWVDRRGAAIELAPAPVTIEVHLARRRLELRRGSRLLRRLRVTIGRPGTSTPTGRFAVTDKLDGRRFGPYYGCCVLALSGVQAHLPAGWNGGSRLAIHGTDAPEAIGTASSAGCLRAADADLRVLMRHVPLGTPVMVRR